jgi:hypothetical protein
LEGAAGMDGVRARDLADASRSRIA